MVMYYPVISCMFPVSSVCLCSYMTQVILSSILYYIYLVSVKLLCIDLYTVGPWGAGFCEHSCYGKRQADRTPRKTPGSMELYQCFCQSTVVCVQRMSGPMSFHTRDFKFDIHFISIVPTTWLLACLSSDLHMI